VIYIHHPLSLKITSYKRFATIESLQENKQSPKKLCNSLVFGGTGKCLTATMPFDAVPINRIP